MDIRSGFWCFITARTRSFDVIASYIRFKEKVPYRTDQTDTTGSRHEDNGPSTWPNRRHARRVPHMRIGVNLRVFEVPFYLISATAEISGVPVASTPLWYAT